MTSQSAVPLWVHGATGMLAGELLRLLEQHPRLRLAGAVSRSGRSLGEAHPHLTSRAGTTGADEAERAIAAELAAGRRAALVLALPHGQSGELWPRLRARLGAAAAGEAPALASPDAPTAGARDAAEPGELFVVDLAADFRLRDPDRYRAAYGRDHPCPEELAGFAYGLPELARMHQRLALRGAGAGPLPGAPMVAASGVSAPGAEPLRGARRAAAPGCFATALQLAVVPAAAAGLLDPSKPWILHGVTGSSGSGAEPKPGTHHPHRHGNLWAYSLGGHRHEAELAQALEPLGARGAGEVSFVAHSGPFARGIHLTASLPLARATSSDGARALYAAAFEGEPFVEVLGEGVPDLRSVCGSNRAAIAASARGSVLTVLVALDNLVKGGSGQALQCLNLMLGFPETWGLPRAGLGVS